MQQTEASGYFLGLDSGTARNRHSLTPIHYKPENKRYHHQPNGASENVSIGFFSALCGTHRHPLAVDARQDLVRALTQNFQPGRP